MATVSAGPRAGLYGAPLALICLVALASGAIAESVTTPIPQSLTTPASIETGIGTLQFPKGVPTADTAQSARAGGFAYYGASSKWLNPLFVGGYDFTRPPPEITRRA
jgi:hypothetical protein